MGRSKKNKPSKPATVEAFETAAQTASDAMHALRPLLLAAGPARLVTMDINTADEFKTVMRGMDASESFPTDFNTLTDAVGALIDDQGAEYLNKMTDAALTLAMYNLRANPGVAVDLIDLAYHTGKNRQVLAEYRAAGGVGDPGLVAAAVLWWFDMVEAVGERGALVLSSKGRQVAASLPRLDDAS